MVELSRAVEVNVPLVERLVKKHFGPQCTSRLAWSVIRGRYVPSDIPRRIAAPQNVFGIRVWWKTIGEFSDNIGLRLELWDPALLAQAQALVEEHNAQTTGAGIELYCPFAGSPPAERPTAA
jgi:hypothetical protein